MPGPRSCVHDRSRHVASFHSGTPRGWASSWQCCGCGCKALDLELWCVTCSAHSCRVLPNQFEGRERAQRRQIKRGCKQRLETIARPSALGPRHGDVIQAAAVLNLQLDTARARTHVCAPGLGRPAAWTRAVDLVPLCLVHFADVGILLGRATLGAVMLPLDGRRSLRR